MSHLKDWLKKERHKRNGVKVVGWWCDSDIPSLPFDAFYAHAKRTEKSPVDPVEASPARLAYFGHKAKHNG
jgi:hypothetical protein